MCEQTKRYFSPRLVDYVIIVGCRHPNKYNHVTQTPELLRRYPLEDHKDFALPPDVIFFCQPEGCINTGHQRAGLQQTTSFVFTLTEKDSNRQRFGVCVNFYRHFSRRTCASHSHPPHRSNGTDSSDDGTGRTSHASTQEQSARDTSENFERKRKRRLRNNTLTSICLISHHPFFTRFRECLITLKTIVDACNERSCAKRTGASRGTSRETVWDILTGQACESTTSVVARELREIETWILRLLSAPVSIPGKTKVLIETLPNGPPMLFALPDHTRFSLVDFPLHLPLELLGVDLCIRVLTLIMLESKVVFQSRDYNALTMSVLALVALLYPLEYMFPVIPLLPTCMTGAEQLLLIPTPFIIGVPASFFPYKGMASKRFDDIWIVDLDANQITPPRLAEPCFDIPEYEYSILSNHLKQALGSMSADIEPIHNFEPILHDKAYVTSPKPSSLKTYNPFIFGNDIDSVDIATRVAMVRFFNSPNILGSFTEHTRTLRLHPRAVVAFQYTSFVRSRPVKSAFVMRLAKTQAVEFFAEWSLCPDNVAFLRVQTGVYDPALIGDKPKWYSRHLTAVPFSIIEENSTLGQAIASLNDPSNDKEQTPTDESGSDSEEDSPNSCYSSLSDFVFEMRNSEICGEILENKVYPENQERMAFAEYARVYNPPEELQMPESIDPNSNSNESGQSMSESTISSSSNSDFNSQHHSPVDERPPLLGDLPEGFLDIDSKSSSATITPVAKTFPKPLFDMKPAQVAASLARASLTDTHRLRSSTVSNQRNRSSERKLSLEENPAPPAAPNKMTQSLILSDDLQSPASPTVSSTRTQPFPFPRPNRRLDRPNLIQQGAPHCNTIIANRQRDFIRQQSVELKANTHSENQQFLKEIVNNVLDGLGIGWLKISRVKKLMEDENYRNFVLSRLNVNLDKKYSDEDDHIEDVKISRTVFKGMTSILRAVIQGLEATSENNGVGGMASTFQLLEIAHTHYWEKDAAVRNDISPMSERNSPLNGSRESLASIDPNAAISPLSNLATLQKPVTLASPTAQFVAHLDTADVNGDDYQNIEIPLEGAPNSAETNNANAPSATEPQDRPDSLSLPNQVAKTRINISRISSITTDHGSEVESVAPSRRDSNAHPHSTDVPNQWDSDKLAVRRMSTASSIKSSLSVGYRFCNGSMMQVADHNAIPSTDKQYLFEALVYSSRSHLWDQMQIWEDVFLDAVAQERDIIGLDQGPAEMMERYYSLSSSDRKRLELDEDRLLAVMLHNLIAFMIMMRVNKDEIRRKIRRMLGRCHIGLTMSQQVNELIDNISNLNGNDVDLRPVGSRVLQKQSFTVHWGTDNTGDMLFMEVWDDCLILRSVLGEVYDRCWFEKLVNMTFSPKTRVLCLWRKVEGETQLTKFYTKRCRDLYFAIKEAMEKAAARLKGKLPGQEIGGEFPIKDMSTGEGGLIQICLEGICLTFENEKEFIELQKIRKCTTHKGDVFVLEEFDSATKEIRVRKYKSTMAHRILLAFHRIVSIVVERRKLSAINGNHRRSQQTNAD